jgi:hypothetical protein
MKMDWTKYVGNLINVTMFENYGLTLDPSDSPVYEIVFKAGKLVEAFDEGLLLETEREKQLIKIFIPHKSIKCVEIFNM